METNESCNLCEKLVITVETNDRLDSLLELPNTFSFVAKRYEWVHHKGLTYALVPRSAHGTTGYIDLYLCLDEDDLDDIDLEGLAAQFLREEVFSTWDNYKSFHLTQPNLDAPIDIGCWKLHHQSLAAGEE